MKIGTVDIGRAFPCRFVAELSNNHNGSLDRAMRLIDAAKWAGAAFVKFQCYTPDELVALRGDGPAPEPWGAQGWTMRTLYEQAQTPLAWFSDLFAYARRQGIVPFSSVFGADSLACLEAVDCPAYKIARLDNERLDLALPSGKPVLVSSSRTDTPRDADLHLYCPPGYPPLLDSIALPDFHRSPYLGLSSHCLAPEIFVAAAARGCKLIEVHLQLDVEPSALEAHVSMTEFQLQATIASVRRTEEMLPDA